MGIKRLDDLPEGSGSLTSDDILIFVDNPSGSGVTKKINLGQIAGMIWNSDMPATINANVSILTNTKNSLDSYVLPSGELGYAHDEGTLRIGNGVDLGGSRIVGETYFVSETNTNNLTNPTALRTNVAISNTFNDLDPAIKLIITNPANKISYFRGTCKATFVSTSGNILPTAYIYTSGINSNPFKHSISTVDLLSDLSLTDTVSKINKGTIPFIQFAEVDYTVSPGSSSVVFFYETDTFYFSASGLCTIGLAWGCSGSALRTHGSLEVTRIK